MEKIVVLGHKNPDVDSIVSGYLLTNYLRYKKYDAEYVIPDNTVDDEVKGILDKVGIDINNFSSEILSCAKLILVDHYETTFDNEVLAVIDHHPTVKIFSYPYYLNEVSPSTTKHIYDLVVNECPKYISRRFMELVLVGMAVDTCSFRSAKATKEDETWFLNMCNKYDLNANEILDIGDCLTDIKDLDKASVHGYKFYNYNGVKVGASGIQIKSISEDDVNLILEKLSKEVVEKDLSMWVFVILNLETNTSRVYKVTSNNVAVDDYDFVVSRAVNIMPKIEEDILTRNI